MKYHFFRFLKRCLKIKKSLFLKSKDFIISKKNKNNIPFFETRNRSLRILPFLVGFQCSIYKGKDFMQIYLLLEHCNFRLGEFSFARRLSRDMHKHLVKKVELKAVKK